MDGTEYESPDDAPIPLHPNCKCRIEEIVDDEPSDDDEPCDCVERLDALIAELEEGQSEAESVEIELQAETEDLEKMVSRAENIIEEMNETLSILEDEYGQHLSDCQNNIDAIYDEISGKVEEVKKLLQEILDLLETAIAYLKVFAVFCSNYVNYIGSRPLSFREYEGLLKEKGIEKISVNYSPQIRYGIFIPYLTFTDVEARLNEYVETQIDWEQQGPRLIYSKDQEPNTNVPKSGIDIF